MKLNRKGDILAVVMLFAFLIFLAIAFVVFLMVFTNLYEALTNATGQFLPAEAQQNVEDWYGMFLTFWNMSVFLLGGSALIIVFLYVIRRHYASREV